MAGWEYIIDPLPGHDMADAVENPQLWNSRIKIMDGRTLIGYLPMTERNAYRKDLRPPPQYYILEEMRTPEGLIPIEKTVPENTLTPQVNPFHQIIYAIVANVGRAKIETIYKGLVNEYRVLPDNAISHGVMIEIIKLMDSRAQLLYYVENGIFHYIRGKPLDTDEVHLIDFQRGYDPIAWQILDFIKSYGHVSQEQINNFIIISIGWLRQIDSIGLYLKGLEKGELWGESICSQKAGNIERVRENEYQYKYPLEPWGEKTV